MPGEHSSFTWIPVDAQGERSIYMFPNVTGKITPPHPAHQAKHFPTEASQLPLAPVEVAMRIAREAGLRVIFDLDVALSYLARAGLGRQEDLVAALRWVDVLKPCKAAARELTGESDYEKMARKFLEMGCARVVMAMGAEGCLIASREQVAHLSSFRA